jgi:hypothetical protein
MKEVPECVCLEAEMANSFTENYFPRGNWMLQELGIQPDTVPTAGYWTSLWVRQGTGGRCGIQSSSIEKSRQDKRVRGHVQASATSPSSARSLTSANVAWKTSQVEDLQGQLS